MHRTSNSTYDAQYGAIHVFEFGNHKVHFDNTTGKERIYIEHGTSGNYHEITSSGNSVSVSMGHVSNYNKGGVTLTVDENNDVKISGHSRMLVGGGAHIEVAGDAGVVVGGDAAVAGVGKMNIRASSAYLGTDGDLNINAGGGINVEAAGDITMKGANIRLN